MRLHQVLKRVCPPELAVLSFGAGIDLDQRKTCYIPDTLVTTEAAEASHERARHRHDPFHPPTELGRVARL